MNAERFFDDLARTLAEPMPRRRAARVIGASLVAIAVSGVSPQASRAQSAPCSVQCRSGGRQYAWCAKFNRLTGEDDECTCCGYPLVRYQCGFDGLTCTDTCPPTNPRSRKPQESCSSADTVDGNPKSWACCTWPSDRCDPTHPELCLPNCKALNGPRSTDCGNTCCPRGQRCKNARTGQCAPCPRGRQSCGNECCSSGKQCTECLERKPPWDSSERLAPNGKEKCCAPDEKCCGNKCCKKSGESCCGSTCCKSPDYCAYSRGQSVCCPPTRLLRVPGSGLTYCCPRGTLSIRGKGCCGSDADCCPPRAGNNVLNCSSLEKVCVNGVCVTP